MQSIGRKIIAGCVVAGGVALAVSDVRASDVSFAGKQIQLLIGTGAGDTLDSYARLIGRYLTKHLPGSPVVVPSNRAGAGSLMAVNATYNSQVRDGTMLVMGQRFVPLMPLLGLPGAQFDPIKMAYIGSISSETSVCIAHERTGVSNIEQAKGRPMIVGTMGAGTELANFTATINRMLGIDYHVVRGYGSSGEIDLAIDRGELQGRCGVSYSSLMRTRGDGVASGQLKIYLQIGVTRSREMPNIPALGELVSEVDQAALKLLAAPGAMARPVFGPPDTAPERLAAIRKAFDAAMVDTEFLADAKRQNLDVMPMSGADIEGLLRELYASNPKVIARARELAGATN